jgi:ABC-2 type transport system permease protein
MLRNVFAKTLRDQRRVLTGWLIGITAVGVLYASFYPAINSPEMAQALDAFPKGLLDALGFADVASPAGYLGSTTFGLLGPALVIVMAAALGGSAVAGDEELGRLDLTLAHPVSRWALVGQRFAALVVAMLMVGAAVVIGVAAISGPAQLDGLGFSTIAAAGLHLAFLGILFGALALATGAATGRRALVYAVVAIVAIGGFFGNNLGPSVEGLAWLRDISPFHYYSGGLPLRNGVQVIDLTVLAGVSLLLVVAGGLVFDRRDVAV